MAPPAVAPEILTRKSYQKKIEIAEDDKKRDER
jgi:hypothetical protein